MKSFTIDEDQVARIAAALCADELARRFGRYVEGLTLSTWTGATPVGEGGAAIEPDQLPACAARAAIFFGQPEDAVAPAPTDTFGDWARVIAENARSELTAFRLHPATHGGVADTRHPADDIYQDARGVAGLMQGRRRVVSMVAPGSLLGLVCTVLAPNLQRLAVIDGRRLTPDELADTLAFGDVVVATPTLWRYLADTLPSVPGNVVGMSYGEPLGAGLAERLRGRGIASLREIYGSTETGVVGWRDSPSDPFVLFDHWRRDGASLVRHRANGAEAGVVPMDALAWDGERTFRLGGRRDGAVQIAGVNVFPAKIAEAIEGHEAVAEATVRLSQRPGALDRLIAHLSLVPGRGANQELAWSVDEWCRAHLQPAERPRIYTFSESAAGAAAGDA